MLLLDETGGLRQAARHAAGCSGGEEGKGGRRVPTAELAPDDAGFPRLAPPARGGSGHRSNLGALGLHMRWTRGWTPTTQLLGRRRRCNGREAALRLHQRASADGRRIAGFMSRAGGGPLTPDLRIMIPAQFGLVIENSGLVGHAVGHSRTIGCAAFRVSWVRRWRPLDQLRRQVRRGVAVSS
jgi:hypothetical protein